MKEIKSQINRLKKFNQQNELSVTSVSGSDQQKGGLIEDEIKECLLELWNDKEDKPMMTEEQPTIYVSLMKIADIHPIFDKFDQATVKIILQAGTIVSTKAKQILFKEMS
jgi:methylglyoxal synthase